MGYHLTQGMHILETIRTCGALNPEFHWIWKIPLAVCEAISSRVKNGCQRAKPFPQAMNNGVALAVGMVEEG